MYHMNAQEALGAQRVPEAAGVRYLPLYPPQVSIFFAPLAYLSYEWALVSWWIFSAVVYGICCYSVWRACPNLREHWTTVFLVAAGFPAFFHLIAWGQTSAVALACFTLIFFLLGDSHDFLAGLVLGCLIFKPQLGLATAIVFLSIGAWKTVAGAALSAIGQLTVGILYYGIEPFRQWIRMVWNVSNMLPLLDPKPYQTHSLRTFWSMLVPWHGLSVGLYLSTSAVVLGLTIACWKGGQAAPLPLRYGALLFATVLVAPHLTVYDLVILAPGFIVLADWLLGKPVTPSNRRLGTFLYVAYMSPLIGPLAIWTHIQLSVIAMAAVVYLIWQIYRQGSANAFPATTRMDHARIAGT